MPGPQHSEVLHIWLIARILDSGIPIGCVVFVGIMFFPKSFMIQNGTRQSSVLSPYLFPRYIKELLGAVANSGIGCNVANQFVNILAYAVLIAPSWRGLQQRRRACH